MKKATLTLIVLWTLSAWVQAREESHAPSIHRGEKGASEVSPDVYSHFLKALVLERSGEFDKALKEYNRSLEIEPGASLVYRQRASLHMKMGNPEKALEDTREFVKTHPGDQEALFLLSNIYITRGQNAAGRAVLEDILKRDPKNEEALMTLGLLLINDDPTAAAGYLEKLAKTDPGSVDAFYHLGLLYQKQGDLERARQMFSKVIEMDPDSLPSLFLLGQMSEQSGDAEAAIRFYEDALLRMPENFPLRMQLILLYAQKMNFGAVGRLLEFYQGNPDAPPEVWLWMGVVAEGKRDWEAARANYQKALEQIKTPEVYLRLANSYSHLEKPKEALRVLKELLAQNPRNSQHLYFLGLAYVDLKRPRRAIEVFQKAVALRPDFSSAYFQIGVAYDALKDWPAAEHMLLQAVKVDTANASAYNYLGYTYADRNEKLFQARRYIERALELEQNNPAFIDSLGWLDYREGKYDLALMHLKAAAEISPDPIIYDHLGDCYRALKQWSDAAVIYSKSLDLDPKNRAVRKKLEALNRWLVPTNPARKLLKRLEFQLSQSPHLSGLVRIEARGGWGGAPVTQGLFYFRHREKWVNPSTATFFTEMRVDLKGSALGPALTLRYQDAPFTRMSIFPPEAEPSVPAETPAVLQTVAEFLSGRLLESFDRPETTVEEKGSSYLLTKGSDCLALDKKTGAVRRIAVGGMKVDLGRYHKVGELLLPETLSFQPSADAARAQKFQIRFSGLSLDPIENRIFDVGSAP